jgi:cobalt-zinc-cadmium efflux system membrane fusion protein
VVRELRRAIGQTVRRGDVLAMVESNESLTNYAVTSSLTGRVIDRPVAPGQNVTQETVMFTVTDLSTVWIELGVYPNQLGRIRSGQAARVVSTSDSSRAQDGTISYVAPTLESESRVSLARIVLSNPGQRWEPGMFVDVTVTIDHANAEVAVPDDAIVRTAEGPAVFVVEGDVFRRQRVEIGRSDGQHTEILSGLSAGTPIVARNAYVLKSELEKSEYAE